jgi:hypothetical protein
MPYTAGSADDEGSPIYGVKIPAGSRDARSVRLAETLSPSHVSPSWKPGLRSNYIRDRAIYQLGAVRRTRGARAPHSGQADGSSHSAIARSRVNGPHFLHIYSYVGIDHLPPA